MIIDCQRILIENCHNKNAIFFNQKKIKRLTYELKLLLV